MRSRSRAGRAVAPRRSPLLRRAGGLALPVGLGLLLAAGCWLERSGTAPEGTAGTAGSAGQGGTGGGPCVPSECPGPDTDCLTPACEFGECALQREPAGAPCDENGGSVCNADGQCVKTNGQPCSSNTECFFQHCVEGLCCDTACSGPCRSCAGGTCLLHAAGTDPDLDCTTAPAGVCDGAGECARGGVAWSDSYGTDHSNQAGLAIAATSAGSVVVGGRFDGTLPVGGTSLVASNGTDGFVALLGPTGAPVWAVSFPSDGDGQVLGVAVDANDDVIAVGSVVGQATFGTTVLDGFGDVDAFAVKLHASDGAVLWARHYGDAAFQEAVAVAIDGSGSIAVTGSYAGTVNFGGSTVGPATGLDLFVLRLAGSGSETAAWSFGGPGNDVVQALAIDGNANLWLAGCFADALTFGATPLAWVGGQDVFVAKLTQNGGHLVSFGFGSSGEDCAHGIAVGHDDAVVLGGTFEAGLDFGNGALSNSGGQDVFVAQLAADGSTLHSISFGDGTTDQRARAVATDVRGNVVVVGDFLGALDFDGAGPDAPIGGAGRRDGFVVKLSADLELLWRRAFGDGQDQFAHAVAVDAEANVLLTGTFESSLDLGGDPLTSAGNFDWFVGKLGP